MIETGITIRGDNFGYALDRIRDAAARGIGDPRNGTLAVQARLLAETAQRLTPPKNKSQGQVAVKRDTNRAARAIAAKSFDDKKLRAIVQKNDKEAWNAASKYFKKAEVRGTQAVDFDPSVYSKPRDRRGRVGRDQPVALLGPQAALGRTHVRKKILPNVGWARAGWNMAITALGGRIRGAWISRHGLARGMFSQNTSATTLKDMWIKFGNDTGWGKGGESGRIARDALKIRVGAMKTYFETQMKLAAREAARMRRAA